MNRAIAVFSTATVLIGLVPAAFAQSLIKGSAAQLNGLQSRSANLTSSPTSYSPRSTTGTSNRSSDGRTGFQPDNRVELLVRPEQDQSSGGVYPRDNTADGNRVQIRYRLDQ